MRAAFQTKTRAPFVSLCVLVDRIFLSRNDLILFLICLLWTVETEQKRARRSITATAEITLAETHSHAAREEEEHHNVPKGGGAAADETTFDGDEPVLAHSSSSTTAARHD